MIRKAIPICLVLLAAGGMMVGQAAAQRAIGPPTDPLDRGAFEAPNESWDLGAGIRAFTSGNYDAALQILMPLARQGDASAQLYVGVMYYRGQGVVQDLPTAAQWFQRSADQANDIAMNNLGTMYRDGKGVGQDYLQARSLFRRAALAGNVDAQNNLGAMLANGQGGPQDLVEAYAWLKLATDQGQVTAQDNLRKVQSLMDMASLYAGQSRSAQLAGQILNARRAYREGGSGPGFAPTTPDVTSAYSRAYDAFTRQDYTTALRLARPLAEQGVSDAQVLLGLMYSHGNGVPQDERAALTWYRKAADQGNVRALNNLGVFYRDGRAVPQDYGIARGYFQRAAMLNDDEAQNNMGLLYYDGQGVRQDMAEAYAWVKLSADQGNALGRSNLAIITRRLSPTQQVLADARSAELKRQIADNARRGREGGTGANPYTPAPNSGPTFEQGAGAYDRGDYTGAYQTLRPLAEQGDPQAQMYVGTMFVLGQGVPKDPAQGEVWLRRAAVQGNAQAINNLGVLYRDGQGVEQDYHMAREFFEESALMGNSDAQNNYGALLVNGQGGSQNLIDGYMWMHLAARNGNTTAKNNLNKAKGIADLQSDVGKALTMDLGRAIRQMKNEGIRENSTLSAYRQRKAQWDAEHQAR